MIDSTKRTRAEHFESGGVQELPGRATANWCAGESSGGSRCSKLTNADAFVERAVGATSEEKPARVEGQFCCAPLPAPLPCQWASSHSALEGSKAGASAESCLEVSEERLPRCNEVHCPLLSEASDAARDEAADVRGLPASVLTQLSSSGSQSHQFKRAA